MVSLFIQRLVSQILTILGLVQVAQPYEQSPSNKKIRTIAICAGSGASVFQGVDADLYFTGEMQHVSPLLLP